MAKNSPATSRAVCRLLVLSGPLLLCAAGGCGGEPTYDVSGKVVLADGTPLAAGQVEFNAVEGPVSAVGYIEPDGTFRLNTNGLADGALAGLYRVAVKPPPMPEMIPGQEEKAERDVAARNSWLQKVPARYHDPETSGIELEVTDRTADNRFTITIEP